LNHAFEQLPTSKYLFSFFTAQLRKKMQSWLGNINYHHEELNFNRQQTRKKKYQGIVCLFAV
jgi:hypothetical protein